MIPDLVTWTAVIRSGRQIQDHTVPSWNKLDNRKQREGTSG
jgi:hypothetical protein